MDIAELYKMQVEWQKARDLVQSQIDELKSSKYLGIKGERQLADLQHQRARLQGEITSVYEQIETSKKAGRIFCEAFTDVGWLIERIRRVHPISDDFLGRLTSNLALIATRGLTHLLGDDQEESGPVLPRSSGKPHVYIKDYLDALESAYLKKVCSA